MAEPAKPFSMYESEVRSEWLDYNGHMHDASYAIVLSDANEEFFHWLDLSADYRAKTGAAFYTVEMHIRFVAECSEGQRLTATTLLISADAKAIRLYTEVFADVDLVATGDSLYVHVDGTVGASRPMPSDRQARLDTVLTSQASLPRPGHLGRGVGYRLARPDTPDSRRGRTP